MNRSGLHFRIPNADSFTNVGIRSRYECQHELFVSCGFLDGRMDVRLRATLLLPGPRGILHHDIVGHLRRIAHLLRKTGLHACKPRVVYAPFQPSPALC